MTPFQVTNSRAPRLLDLPKLTTDSDVILCCITEDDVDQFCEDYEQTPLTDDEMQDLYYVLGEDSRLFEMLYDAVDEVRNGGLRRDLASARMCHAASPVEINVAHHTHSIAM